jgi:porin
VAPAQFSRERLSLLGGRYDLNGEFYRLHSAALFLNSSFGMGPEFSQSGPGGAAANRRGCRGKKMTKM